MAKRQAEIDRDRCVACGACCKVCPREALTIFKGCYAVVDGVRCVGFGRGGRSGSRSGRREGRGDGKRYGSFLRPRRDTTDSTRECGTIIDGAIP